MKNSNFDTDIIMIGGGLAGLTSAIHLSKLGFSVMVIEKNEYPKHKVCGEYISNEVLPYFRWLEIEIDKLNPTHITELHFSSESGKIIQTKLPLAGFGISRYTLDFALYKKARFQNCRIIQEQVNEVHLINDTFTVILSNGSILKSKVVLGSFGKRSNLDIQMKRSFLNKKSPWLAVKSHYKGQFSDDVVGLHNFKGGYCGVSKVENDLINICYLTDYKSFKKYKNIGEFEDLVVQKNPHLKNIFQKTEMAFEKPLTISQICFDDKKKVENHILMIGDTAGLIHPLCGNGMAMAIHSAKLASEQVAQFLNQKITRKEMEDNYSKNWNKNFVNRIKFGKILGKIFEHSLLAEILTKTITFLPFLLPLIIKKTHGKEIVI